MTSRRTGPSRAARPLGLSPDADYLPPGVLPTELPETEFQAKVIAEAEDNGWLVFHDNDSRRNTPGLPDVLALKPPYILIAELKTGKGRPTKEQQVWIDTARRCMAGNKRLWVRVWRPGDWAEIQRILRLPDVLRPLELER